MGNRQTSRIKMILVALVLAGGLTAVAALGFLEKMDLALSDVWYPKGWSSEGEIVLMGIDQSVLEDIEPYNQFDPYAAGPQDSYLTSNSVQLFFLFAVLLVSALCFWKRPVWFSTVVWLLFSGLYLLLCRFLYHRGRILHILWVPAGVTILYIGMLAYNSIQKALKRLYVARTFKRYVAPEMVYKIFKQGSAALELGGKLTPIAVLFVDIRGFTSLSESLPPLEVVGILNAYLDLISECILKNQGTLDKFMGNAAMAFWGAPLFQEDYAMKAVQAAWDMVRGSENLSVELVRRYGRTVAFGVGVHMGEAVVGNIGSVRRMDYTAIGDTVNTAACLEANAPGGTIYISRAVADALQGRIKATSLGSSIKLKGKKEGFEVLMLDEILPTDK